MLTHVINIGCRNGYIYFYCIYLCHGILFLGDFPASEIYVPTFRKTPSVSSTPINMQHTGCSKNSEHKFQTPENHAKERIQHSEKERKFEIKNMYDNFSKVGAIS
jgi:hypothetical protein